MLARRRSAADCRHLGLTLLEVLLTLCLLVILAALTWPALGRPMAAQRLRTAADKVRTEWVRARVQAMSTGRLYLFRYALDGDGYWIEPQASDDDQSTTMPSNSSTMPTDPSATPADAPQVSGAVPNAASTFPSQHRRLPDKVRFVAGQIAGDQPTAAPSVGANPAASSGPIAASNPAAGIDDSADGGTGLSDPVFFRPDGTCTSVQVRLENEYQQTIDLALRGLTGVVTVGKVSSSEERMP